jgi:predicted chitinase
MIASSRKVFFDEVRRSLFNMKMNQGQVEGCNAILDFYQEKHPCTLPQLAYILATAYHETAHTMQPIEEYGRGRGKKYGQGDPETGQRYYGRGYVQLTWKDNYAKQSKKLGLGDKLVTNPDAVMVKSVALAILFGGSMDGDFTGKSLSHYINNDECDFRNARKVINGLDRAGDIEKYAYHFLRALAAGNISG